MIQKGQDLAFIEELRPHEVGIDAAPDQLNGDFLLELVIVPHGTIDGAHASLPHHFEGPVRP